MSPEFTRDNYPIESNLVILIQTPYLQFIRNSVSSECLRIADPDSQDFASLRKLRASGHWETGMYTFLDQPVDRLCNGGRFLLWGMRGWAHAIEQGTCPPLALSRGFASMHALPALPDFHLAMAMLNRDGLERISVAPIRCQCIIEHEAILISMWHDLANGDLDKMRQTLALLVKSEAVAPIARAMTTTTAKLIAAGFNISSLSTSVMKEAR